MSQATRQQGGFALVAAVFLLVVIGALGAFAVRLNMSQQSGADLDLAVASAEAAVQSGIQYAAARLAGAANCSGVPSSTSLSLPQNFTVRVTCANATVAIAPTVTVFLVTVSATRGSYGSPEFISRQRSVRITPL